MFYGDMRHDPYAALRSSGYRWLFSAHVLMIFIYSSNELGDFESGVTAALLGPVPSVVLGGIGAIVVALLFAYRFPQLRILGKLMVAAE